jgi:DNA-binding CsgD family transcriptional regulator
LIARHFPDFRGPGLPAEIELWLSEEDTSRAPAWPFVYGTLIVRKLYSGTEPVLVVSERTDQPTSPLLAQLGLTSREIDVMTLIVCGNATKDVAVSLAISPRTVSKHIERSLSKLGVDSRLAAANLINELAQ